MKVEAGGLEQVLNSLWKLLVMLVTQTPFTLIAIVVLVGVYYYFRLKFFYRLKNSKKIESFPYWLQFIFDKLMSSRSKTSNSSIFQTILKLIEFCVIVFLAIALLKIVGFKIPEGIF